MRDVLVTNASELVVPEPQGRGVERRPRHAVWIRQGRVAWTGPEADCPPLTPGAERVDAQGGAVMPALVDAHTHLVFAGDRLDDFEARTRGETYATIAARGGGILTTVRATRLASLEALVEGARRRVAVRGPRYGIGTTEVKSGYGLELEAELRMLQAVQVLRRDGYDLEGTLLAAHAVPRDRDRDGYVQEIVDVMIPRAAAEGLARFVDVFVERGAYTVDEARRIFAAAHTAGLIPRIHADQLTAGGGAALAAEVGAASADHLEHTTDADLGAMARAGVVAMLLPGAATFLGDRAPELGARARAAGVEVAVATDTNPGSSPLQNLPLAATLAVTTMGLTVGEALRAVTLGGAHALRRGDIGHLEVGALGRVVVLDHADARALVYAYGEPIVRQYVDATRPA